MSRVHDALRRAEQNPDPANRRMASAVVSAVEAQTELASTTSLPPSRVSTAAAVMTPDVLPERVLGREFLERIREIPYSPSQEAHILDVANPYEAPAEEFRTIRTRLNHMQSLQPISSVVVTSPSPAEGKSFAAVNLALAQAQLEGQPTLLVDCDFRRPNIHSMFRIDRSPGLTDYLLGKAPLEDCVKRVAGSGLYVIPAGEAVINPLELLNLRDMRDLMEQFSQVFRWTILDSPPLLFAADANLLSTLCSGAILVVRIGATTIDSVTRAMQSLSHNNVLGIIANGARRGELYSKYTYYHSYAYGQPADAQLEEEERS